MGFVKEKLIYYESNLDQLNCKFKLRKIQNVLWNWKMMNIIIMVIIVRFSDYCIQFVVLYINGG